MREDGKMKALGDAIVAIIGVAMFAICAIIILTADYNPIRAQMYALFACRSAGSSHRRDWLIGIGPVAQLDRARDFESRGCEFKSCQDRQHGS